VACQAEDGGHAVALGRAGRPATRYDGLHAVLIETGLNGERLAVETLLGAQLRYAFQGFHADPQAPCPARGSGVVFRQFDDLINKPKLGGEKRLPTPSPRFISPAFVPSCRMCPRSCPP